jgi:hypothetical protein
MVIRRLTRPTIRPTIRSTIGSGVAGGGGGGIAELLYINNTGQSNSEGTIGTGSEGITQTQENDAIGVTRLQANPVAAYGIAPLINEYFGRNDAINGWKSENPIFGAVGFLYQLIQDENGKSPSQYNKKLIGSNNGQAGASLSGLSQGTAKYNAAIAQAEALKGIADNAGIRATWGMTMWLQGEAETGNTNYKTDLAALVDDYKTDSKVATGQTVDPIFVTWQLCVGTTSTTNIAPAQLELSNERSDVYCSGPTYHLPRLDGTHFTPTGYKWLGAYFGLAYKRAVIDGVGFEPLQPASSSINGNSIDIVFNKSGLTFDTSSGIPEQTNYGFDVEEADGTAVTVSSVSVLSTNTIRITCDTTPEAGWVVKYGYDAMTGITDWDYSGVGGNLRDNAGDSLIYEEISKPMHNWCCTFEREI